MTEIHTLWLPMKTVFGCFSCYVSCTHFENLIFFAASNGPFTCMPCDKDLVLPEDFYRHLWKGSFAFRIMRARVHLAQFLLYAFSLPSSLGCPAYLRQLLTLPNARVRTILFTKGSSFLHNGIGGAVLAWTSVRRIRKRRVSACTFLNDSPAATVVADGPHGWFCEANEKATDSHRRGRDEHCGIGCRGQGQLEGVL